MRAFVLLLVIPSCQLWLVRERMELCAYGGPRELISVDELIGEVDRAGCVGENLGRETGRYPSIGEAFVHSINNLSRIDINCKRLERSAVTHV